MEPQLNSMLSPAERRLYQNTKEIRELLRTARTIAVVGLSTEKTKASNMVASYLLDEGYEVIPVHPKADSILGRPAYASADAIPFAVDIVNVFRPASEIDAVVEQAIRNGAKAVWTQLRIVNLSAMSAARSAGLIAVADRCIKIEHGRYGGALHWAGMNTEVITARRR
jgi:predicted CoA-binding protein